MKGRQMNEVFLSKGAHPSREAGMCAMEFGAYLAGLEHTDKPACVSPVLLDFMINFNDSLDDEKRQGLRTYIVRTLGTAGDGQDARRRCMALDWLIRSLTPAFLDLGGLSQHAGALRSLQTITGPGRAGLALPSVRAARDAASAAASAAARAAARDPARAAASAAARAAAWDAAWDAASAAASAASAAAWAAAWAAARDAASAAARAAAWDAAWDAASAAASAASAAAWAAAWAAARDAASAAARDAAWDAAWDAASAAARDAASAASAALQPTVDALQESAFGLLDRMIDPGGLHDVKTEAEWLAAGRA
jgi:hypothetical protein